jgi:hypothetical protein
MGQGDPCGDVSFSGELSYTIFEYVILRPSPLQDSNTSLFPNYVSQPVTSSPNFLDASSTALLASTVYRLSLLRGEHTYLPLAEKSRKALSATDPNNLSQLVHFTSEGWLTPVVNPDDFPNQGSNSPEGQAFVAGTMKLSYTTWWVYRLDAHDDGMITEEDGIPSHVCQHTTREAETRQSTRHASWENKQVLMVHSTSFYHGGIQN